LKGWLTLAGRWSAIGPRSQRANARGTQEYPCITRLPEPLRTGTLRAPRQSIIIDFSTQHQAELAKAFAMRARQLNRIRRVHAFHGMPEDPVERVFVGSINFIEVLFHALCAQ